MRKQKICCLEKFKNLELRLFTLVGQYCISESLQNYKEYDEQILSNHSHQSRFVICREPLLLG